MNHILRWSGMHPKPCMLLGNKVEWNNQRNDNIKIKFRYDESMWDFIASFNAMMKLIRMHETPSACWAKSRLQIEVCTTMKLSRWLSSKANGKKGNRKSNQWYWRAREGPMRDGKPIANLLKISCQQVVTGAGLISTGERENIPGQHPWITN